MIDFPGTTRLATSSAASRRVRLAIKRLLDLVLTSVLIVLLSPLMAIIALAVLIRSGRPILFRQTRVGRNGEQFVMLKFRTMSLDAETTLHKLTDLNERSGPLFKLQNDPRITPVGRLLRRASLDELPQLFNVLSGQMSLVGPRPALPHEVEEFPASLRVRESMPQGLTGLWQVVGRTDADFATYEQLDVRYIEHWSLRLDAKIILRTPFVVLKHAFDHSPVHVSTGLADSVEWFGDSEVTTEVEQQRRPA